MKKKNRHAVILGRRGGKAGKGKRAEAARTAANARWEKARKEEKTASQPVDLPDVTNNRILDENKACTDA